jgi:hypothetical protein
MAIDGEAMNKYSNSEDIYDDLVENSEEDWLYGLVSFAIIEEQRIEWAKHFTTHNKRPPNQEETQSWYNQQPSSVLLRAKGTAETALQAFTTEALDLIIESQTKEIEQGIIVKEIKSLNRFWPQFGVNVAGGLAAAAIFAALLIILAVFVLNDASPASIGDQLSNKLELSENGEK